MHLLPHQKRVSDVQAGASLAGASAAPMLLVVRGLHAGGQAVCLKGMRRCGFAAADAVLRTRTAGARCKSRTVP